MANAYNILKVKNLLIAKHHPGQSAVKALLRPEYNSANRPPVTGREDAIILLQNLNRAQFFLLADRSEPPASGGPRKLDIIRNQSVYDEGYYVLFYQGSQVTSLLASFSLIGIVIAGVMFPLWPNFMREGAWYVSVAVLAFLGLLFIIAIIRLIVYILTLFFLSPGIWIFPNLFEDVGFVDSFIPFWAWDNTAEKKRARLLREQQRLQERSGETSALDSDRKDD